MMDESHTLEQALPAEAVWVILPLLILFACVTAICRFRKP
jgi:hypothetical protein